MLVPEVPGYTKLQREMHDALRAQHPEWINADGKSPRCDYYESLFATLLVSHQAHARELLRPSFKANQSGPSLREAESQHTR